MDQERILLEAGLLDTRLEDQHDVPPATRATHKRCHQIHHVRY